MSHRSDGSLSLGSFVSDLYREGLALGQRPKSLVKPSLTQTGLGSLWGRCTCPAVPPCPEWCPVHGDGPVSSLPSFSDPTRSQEILPSSEGLDMHGLQAIVSLCVDETEMVKCCIWATHMSL